MNSAGDLMHTAVLGVGYRYWYSLHYTHTNRNLHYAHTNRNLHYTHTNRNLHYTHTNRTLHYTHTNRNLHYTHTNRNLHYTHTNRNLHYTHSNRNLHYTHTNRNLHYTHTNRNLHYTHTNRKQKQTKTSLWIVRVALFDFCVPKDEHFVRILTMPTGSLLTLLWAGLWLCRPSSACCKWTYDVFLNLHVFVFLHATAEKNFHLVCVILPTSVGTWKQCHCLVLV